DEPRVSGRDRLERHRRLVRRDSGNGAGRPTGAADGVSGDRSEDALGRVPYIAVPVVRGVPTVESTVTGLEVTSSTRKIIAIARCSFARKRQCWLRVASPHAMPAHTKFRISSTSVNSQCYPIVTGARICRAGSQPTIAYRRYSEYFETVQ